MGLVKAIYYSVKEVWFVTVTSLNYLGKMITGSADSSQLGGPIRIAKITGQVAEHGIIPFFKYNGLYFNKFRFNKFVPNSLC